MRKKLKEDEGLRKRYTAEFVRIGKRINYNGFSEETVLLKHVKEADTQKEVTDHIWLSLTKAIEKLPLKEGLTLTFEARVKSYRKGYQNNKLGINNKKTDYKLSYPTKFEILRNST
jgi:hypothetical protein